MGSRACADQLQGARGRQAGSAPGQRAGDYLRLIASNDPLLQTVLHPQIGNMVLHGFLHSLSVLESVAAGQFDAIPHFPPPLEEPWRDPEEEGAAAAAAAKPRRQRQRDGGEQEWEEEEGEEAEGEEGRASRGAKRRR